MFTYQNDKLKDMLLEEEGSSYLSYIKNNKLIFFVVLVLLSSNVFLYMKQSELQQNEFVDISCPEKKNSSTELIDVDISGSVLNPGVYSLDSGSLLIDAVNLAGGFAHDSNVYWVSKNLNLSSKLSENSKIYIPFEWEYLEDTILTVENFSNESMGANNDITNNENSNAKNDSPESIITNINNMTKDELMAYKGIGESYSQRILDGVPYSSEDDLYLRSGVPKKTLQNAFSIK